ncbi:MAG: D-aminoacylase [Nitrospirae bacterium]|nr:D-aminoacylase [Nitrospirota bacterium]
MTADLILRGGTVVDGTGAPAYRGDVAIRGGRITAVGAIDPCEGPELDVSGMVVCPGFIDLHAHSEFTLLADGRAWGKILQGVTTEVSGNCGLSAVPLLGEARRQRAEDLRDLGLTQTWEDFAGFARRLEDQGIAVNFCTLVGHGNLRASVMGYANRPPDGREMQEMSRLLEDALKAGAWGLSTGLIYLPGAYAETGEIMALARVARSHGGLYATHLRSEGDQLLEAITEAIRIGEEAGIRVQISHLKTAGDRNWRKLPDALRLIREARERGADVAADRYPYTAASTDLDAILPAWAYEGGRAAELARLKDPDTRARLTEEILASHPRRDDWERVLIASVRTEENRSLEGRTLAEAGALRGCPPWEALYELLLEEDLQAMGIFFSMSEENLREILRQPYLMIGSDSSARATDGPTRQGKPHPRTFGTFPRVLGRFVRNERLLPLELAVAMMTSRPAARLGLDDRGVVQEGKSADLVVFNPEAIRDRATYEDPYQAPEGIRHVFVNGSVVVRDGAPTGARPGRVLRKGG